MIIITGANGKLGRGVVEQLLARVPAEHIGVSVRDPEKAQGLKERGVRVRQGDFNDAASLAHAFEGASQVLVVSSNSSGKAAVRQHRKAIDIAKHAGARRILYTSHMGSSPTSLFPPMVDHAATEAALRDSGVAFTSLRNGYYATSALFMLGNALKTGELAVPEDGPVAWTALQLSPRSWRTARSAGSLCRTPSIGQAWSPRASQGRGLICFWACSARTDKANSPGSTRLSPASSTDRRCPCGTS